MRNLQVEGELLDQSFLRVETQPEVGVEAYDAGAKLLTDFFAEQLELYRHADLAPIGKQIIDMCLSGASVDDYTKMTDNAALPPSFTKEGNPT